MSRESRLSVVLTAAGLGLLIVLSCARTPKTWQLSDLKLREVESLQSLDGITSATAEEGVLIEIMVTLSTGVEVVPPIRAAFINLSPQANAGSSAPTTSELKGIGLPDNGGCRYSFHRTVSGTDLVIKHDTLGGLRFDKAGRDAPFLITPLSNSTRLCLGFWTAGGLKDGGTLTLEDAAIKVPAPME